MNGTASKKRELSKRGKQSSGALIRPTVPTRETAPTSVSRQAGAGHQRRLDLRGSQRRGCGHQELLAFYPERVDAIEERPQ